MADDAPMDDDPTVAKDDSGDLTPEQKQELVELLKSNKKSALWRANVEIWLKWIGAVLTAIIAIKILVMELLKEFLQGVVP